MGHLMYSMPGRNGGGTDFFAHGGRRPGSGRDGVLVGDEQVSLAGLGFLGDSPGPCPFLATSFPSWPCSAAKVCFRRRNSKPIMASAKGLALAFHRTH